MLTASLRPTLSATYDPVLVFERDIATAAVRTERIGDRRRPGIPSPLRVINRGGQYQFADRPGEPGILRVAEDRRIRWSAPSGVGGEAAESVTEGVLRTQMLGTEHREVLAGSECRLTPGRAVVIGRSLGWGGRELHDEGLSRVGLTIELSADGWSIAVGNRNGVVAHPWAQPSFWLDPPSILRSAWPRVGVRLVGTRRDVEYWALLEGSWSVPRPAADPPALTLSTRRPTGVKPLTAQQRDAVLTLFHQHLQWPPVAAPLPRSVAAAASRLGVAPVSLQERLERVQQRAYSLGLHRLVGVSDPAYIHFLVHRGVLRVDDDTAPPV